MVTASRMISIATVRTVVGSTRADAIVFGVTAIITVSFDLIYAVLIGIAAAAFFALRALARSSGVHREELPGPAEPGDERIALFRLEGALFFGAAERMLERVGDIRGVEVVIIRMSQLQILDATGAQVITELITGTRTAGRHRAREGHPDPAPAARRARRRDRLAAAPEPPVRRARPRGRARAEPRASRCGGTRLTSTERDPAALSIPGRRARRYGDGTNRCRRREDDDMSKYLILIYQDDDAAQSAGEIGEPGLPRVHGAPCGLAARRCGARIARLGHLGPTRPRPATSS